MSLWHEVGCGWIVSYFISFLFLFSLLSKLGLDNLIWGISHLGCPMNFVARELRNSGE